MLSCRFQAASEIGPRPEAREARAPNDRERHAFDRLVGTVTKYLPVSGYGMVKSAPGTLALRAFGLPKSTISGQNRAKSAGKRHVSRSPTSIPAPGHMFEGELSFRIDRIMPEFQAPPFV